MTRIAAIAIFIISGRLLSAPSLCSHNAEEQELQIVSETKSCHEHSLQKDAAEKIPCKHMKDCLLDGGGDESFIPKTASITEAEKQIVLPVFAVIFEKLNQRSELRPFACKSPPEFSYCFSSLYKIKSSLLI